jgi:hypothetical protein
MSNDSLTHPSMSSSDLLRRADTTSPMRSSTLEDLATATMLAPATTRCRDELCYVMYLCHKPATIYCWEDYMNYH